MGYEVISYEPDPGPDAMTILKRAMAVHYSIATTTHGDLSHQYNEPLAHPYDASWNLVKLLMLRAYGSPEKVEIACEWWFDSFEIPTVEEADAKVAERLQEELESRPDWGAGYEQGYADARRDFEMAAKH